MPPTTYDGRIVFKLPAAKSKLRNDNNNNAPARIMGKKILVIWQLSCPITNPTTSLQWKPVGKTRFWLSLPVVNRIKGLQLKITILV